MDNLQGNQFLTVFKALNYDAIFLFYSSFLVAIPLAFISFWKPQVSRIVMLVFLGLLTLFNVALTQVYFANQTLLDGSIFLFSWAEIWITVSAEFGGVRPQQKLQAFCRESPYMAGHD